MIGPILSSVMVGEVVGYDRLEQLRKTASEARYRIKAGGKGVIVWEAPASGSWREIATFARMADAEAFVFIMSDPALAMGPDQRIPPPPKAEA